MKLNHLNLTVTDPMETHDFLAKYFGLRSLGGNKNMAFLADDDGAVVVPVGVAANICGVDANVLASQKKSPPLSV